jgi:hypothetical protein
LNLGVSVTARTPSARSKNGIVLVCDSPRRIRVSVSVAALGAILCGICDTEIQTAHTLKEVHGPVSRCSMVVQIVVVAIDERPIQA